MRPTISRSIRVVGVLLAGALALTGCANSSSSDGGGAKASTDGLSQSAIYTQGLVQKGKAAGTPVKGGTLTVAEYGEARSLSPLVTYANGSTGGSALAAVYDELMRYDFNSSSWVPQMAESLTSPDKTTWTLKLRKGVKFSDGTPVDADAVIASIKYYLANYGYQALSMLADQTQLKKVNDLTVQFKLAQPWATFPAMLSAGPGMIMAPAAYKDPKNFKPIGAGPFELDSYSPGEQLVLKAKPSYWGGAPYLDKLRFVFLGADDAKLQSLDSGEVDSAFLRTQSTVEKARRDGYSGMMFVVAMSPDLIINVRKGHPGADLRVRQAIQLAFNAKSYIQRTGNGAGIASQSLFAKTSPWHSDVPAVSTDQAKAKQLLAAAKKADGFNGVLHYLVGGDPTSQAAAVQVKAQLDAVGFDIKIESSPTIADQVKRLYTDHDFDLAISSSSIGDEDPYDGLADSFSTGSPTNLSGYSSPEMGKLLSELRAVSDDPSKGKPIVAQIEELLQKDVPVVLISQSAIFLPWASDVHGIVPTTLQMVLYAKAWKSAK